MIELRMAWLHIPLMLGVLISASTIAIEPTPADPHAQPPLDIANIGVKECAACHSAPSPIYTDLGVTRFVRLVEATEWRERDKHAYAYELVRQDLSQAELETDARKSNKLSVDITSKLNWKIDGEDFVKKCLSCHVGTSASSPFAKRDLEFGVQCESCHGPGSEYTRRENHQQVSWRAKTPDQKSELAMWDLTSPSTSAAVCLSCHLGNMNEGRFVTHDMYAAGHPVLPPFDLQTFLSAMPPHWKPLSEKPIVANSSKSNVGTFELQAEYNLAHFDITGTSEAIQLSIQGSYDKTRRSMIGGLVANDLGIELIHQAAAKTKTWGDYSIYNCMGCHQELKKKQTPFRHESRIPGRPFPANWLTLEYPAIHVSHRDKQETLAREMTASFNAVPFGDALQFNELSDGHRQSLSDRVADRRKMERKVMTKQDVQEWLKFLVSSRHDSLDDYWVAKQTAWMVCVAVDELVEHRELAADSVEPMKKELRETLQLGLSLPQRQSVLAGQKSSLETARSFDVARCKELLIKIVEATATIR